MNRKLNLDKRLGLLNGAERARIILRDINERMYGNGQGVLSQKEIKNLLLMKSPKTLREYRGYLSMAVESQVLVSSAKEVYVRFRFYYECLKKYHWFFSIASGIDFAEGLIQQFVSDDILKAEGQKFLASLRVQSEEDFDLLAETVVNVRLYVSLFIIIKSKVDSIRDKLGLYPLVRENYGDIYERYISHIRHCIDEHNLIINCEIRRMQDVLLLDKLKNCLIQDLN